MIHFYKKRYIYFAISLTIFLVGFIAILVNGIHLDIGFKGGCILKYEFTGEINTEKVDDVVNKAMNRDATSQITTDIATNTKKLSISLAGKKGLSAEDQDKLDAALKTEFKDSNLKLSESNVVEPFIGKHYFKNGMIAIALSFFLIAIYVWIRFRRIGGLSAGVMAIIALIHDVLVAFTIFVIFKMPINDNFIAVALTIIGFSVNDTIVIYDRIRENARTMRAGYPIEDLVDTSITQSMTRSINTALATFFSIVIVYLFAHFYGISSIEGFALPMMFGIISGSYSTICIAGPLWVMWKKHKAKVEAKA
jgi:protein-export membrane protein SecF